MSDEIKPNVIDGGAVLTADDIKRACEAIKNMPPFPILPTQCVCGASLGTNIPRCYWCTEYAALTKLDNSPKLA